MRPRATPPSPVLSPRHKPARAWTSSGAALPMPARAPTLHARWAAYRPRPSARLPRAVHPRPCPVAHDTAPAHPLQILHRISVARVRAITPACTSLLWSLVRCLHSEVDQRAMVSLDIDDAPAASRARKEGRNAVERGLCAARWCDVMVATRPPRSVHEHIMSRTSFVPRPTRSSPAMRIARQTAVSRLSLARPLAGHSCKPALRSLIRPRRRLPAAR
ncbi:hypothetical protein BV20DRAFT_54046 [Pilatotrama ljubarskyi]|nr:hypothetical protein BV20DRAFT_54046 [Pilatotrama ljubarskyi]